MPRPPAPKSGADSTHGGPLSALGGTALAAGYLDGEFSPEDVLAAVHRHIDALNPTLNALVAEDREASRAAAKQSTRRWREGAPLSGLDGVPVTVKDNLFAAGLPATWGSLAYRDFRPVEDEPAIARLRAAGAVVIGKTNVPEFTVEGYTANKLFGATCNPLAPGRTPGGSSGGGAAAVAAGMGPLAIGTDGGGSIRRPASHCGLFGFKPSIGQVPRAGGFRQILADFEVVGPIARELEDIRTALAVMRGPDSRDPRSLAGTAPAIAFPPRLRVGFFVGVGDAPVDRRITAAAERFAVALSDRRLEIVPMAAPFELQQLNDMWALIAACGLAWEVERLGARAAQIGENAQAMAARGAAIGTSRYLDALEMAGRLRAEAGKLFERFDLLLCPTTAALAWPAAEPFPPMIDGKPVGPRGHAIFTAWMNVANLCALSVPVALTPDLGGIGMQLVAPTGRDLDLLDFLLQSRLLDGLVTPSQPVELQ